MRLHPQRIGPARIPSAVPTTGSGQLWGQPEGHIARIFCKIMMLGTFFGCTHNHFGVYTSKSGNSGYDRVPGSDRTLNSAASDGVLARHPGGLALCAGMGRVHRYVFRLARATKRTARNLAP